MLSRYNGIGSLKLSIATAHNRRTSNIYINDVPQKDIHNHQIDVTDSTYADVTSECSSALENARAMRKTSKLNQTPPPNQQNDLKANAKFNLRRKPLKSRQKCETNRTHQPNTAANGRIQKCIPKITSTNSIYSTSTISNSSLQEYDDNELDTTELAKYMRQINKEIIHHDTK